MADFASLQQEIDQAWAYARQARDDNWMARARVILMRQEAQRAYRRVLRACVAPWMQTANAGTQEITATILASHGLLDTRPARPTNGRPR
jgi:hypothetical protein